jgi:hypothetical protein
MPFSQATIQDVVPTRQGRGLKITWTSSSPAGTWFQVYLDRQLTWFGQSLFCVIPMPTPTDLATIDVGTVLESEAPQNLALIPSSNGFGKGQFGAYGFGGVVSNPLPTPAWTGQRVTLSWTGGSPGIVNYAIYSGLTPGGAVSYVSPIGIVAAAPQGQYPTGFGQGGFGKGSFGISESHYSFTTSTLAKGTWNFGIKPVDAQGNPGTATTTSQAVSGPPVEVPRNAAGKRVTYTFSHATGSTSGFGAGGFGSGGFGGETLGAPQATLAWLASPG